MFIIYQITAFPIVIIALYNFQIFENNEKNVKGIVLNAFSTPVVINLELFELVESMESGLKE